MRKNLSEFTEKEQKIMAKYWKKFQDYAMLNEEFCEELGYNGKTPVVRWQRKVPNENCVNDKSLKTDKSFIIRVWSPLCHEDKNKIKAEITEAGKDLLDRFRQHKDELDDKTGLKFDWPRIAIYSDAVDFNDENKWPSQFDWIIKTMLAMKREFKKYLK